MAKKEVNEFVISEKLSKILKESCHDISIEDMIGLWNTIDHPFIESFKITKVDIETFNTKVILSLVLLLFSHS